MTPENKAKMSKTLSGGVHHSPEADIESIRQLLKGYGASRSILKELIQNAEDAGASRMDIIHVAGNADASHPLFRGPGLLVANNGQFTPANRLAIRQINLGTKGTEDRAIGRFGKGLKSVFAWCEAFFIVAHTTRDQEWPEDSALIDFFNPWHGWLHEDWDTDFEQHQEECRRSVEQHLNSANYRDPWLAFWFPLRRKEHVANGDYLGTLRPGDDTGFTKKLKAELQWLAPSLVMLRNLQGIRLTEGVSTMEWEFGKPDLRIHGPNDAPNSDGVPAHGHVILRSESDQVYRFAGVAGKLPDEEVEDLLSSGEWPNIVQRGPNASRSNVPLKGPPHYAALASWVPSEANDTRGQLEARWCVFFPVGEQPTGLDPVELRTIPYRLTLNLHGFFFLDSDRLRIDGLDRGFVSERAGVSDIGIRWNAIIARKGALRFLPRALGDFARVARLSSEQCTELAEAVKKTSIWREFGRDVTKWESWRRRWRPTGDTWEIIPSSRAVQQIPPVFNLLNLLTCIPSLSAIGESHILVTAHADDISPGLHNAPFSPWEEALMLELLDGMVLTVDAPGTVVRWVNHILSQWHESGELTPAILERVADLKLMEVQKSRSREIQRISKRDWDKLFARGSVVARCQETDHWLSQLHEALPAWECYLQHESPPNWLGGESAPPLTPSSVATAITSQAVLGPLMTRVDLVRRLADNANTYGELRRAIRYLMHGNGDHREEDHATLFVASNEPASLVWMRLVRQLLRYDGNHNEWRVIDPEWASSLTPEFMRNASVSSVTAQSAWKEVTTTSMDVRRLEFSVTEWTVEDVAALLCGLFNAGQADRSHAIKVLRRLSIHSLRQRPGVRVSLANDAGNLERGFILNCAEFEASIPPALRDIWSKFLSGTQIVERMENPSVSAIQESLFLDPTPEREDAVAELDWSYVIRRCLEDTSPDAWSSLIIEGLRHGDQAVRGCGALLKKTKWIPLGGGVVASPASILVVNGMEDELHQLFDPCTDGLAGIRAIPDELLHSNGFNTLKNYFPKIDEALVLLGDWLKVHPDWHLGLEEHHVRSGVGGFLDEISSLEGVKGASLLNKLWRLHNEEDQARWQGRLAQRVLPAMFQRFKVNEEASKMEDLLTRLSEANLRIGFEAYLSQAVASGSLPRILTRLDLLNVHGEWRPASSLIWPSENLDPSVQVCRAQADLLSPIREEDAFPQQQAIQGELGMGATHGNQLAEPPDFEVQARVMEQYLQPFRDGNIGDVLPASLVAVLGRAGGMSDLLRTLVSSGLRQNPDDFVVGLLGEDHGDLIRAIQSERFIVKVIRGQATMARTLTGTDVSVDLTEDIESLVVGDPSLLWRRYFYQGNPDTSCHLLRLRAVDRPDDIPDAISVFARTIETILYEAYCNRIRSMVPSNLHGFLAQNAESGQSDLRRSQLSLMAQAEARLRELRAREHAVFVSVMKMFEDARQAQVDAEMLEQNAPDKARKKRDASEGLIKRARHDLREILEGEHHADARRYLVEAIRRRMYDFQYNLSVMLLELFQNADDAVSEWDEMKQGLSPHENHFVLWMSNVERRLDVIHWGRPINRHAFVGFEHGSRRGYDLDLEKMLTLNFSDKGAGAPGESALVTGKFGLGFKTVFFVTDEPMVVSGRLAFRIRGGFYPIPLRPNEALALRRVADVHGNRDLVPTAIRLQWSDDATTADVLTVINKFRHLAPLLALFGRRIRRISLKAGEESQVIECQEKKLSSSGGTVRIRVAQDCYLGFRCRVQGDERPATVLISLDGGGVRPLPKEIPRLWITAPTTETSEYNWALNAPFKPDAGRQRIALNNAANRILADDIARSWFEGLVELYHMSMHDWESLRDQLGLHAQAARASWWRHLWCAMTPLRPTLDWADLREGGQVLEYIAWGSGIGAYARLTQSHDVVPTMLPGIYDTLVKASDVRFRPSGLLGSLCNGCFEQITGWTSVQLAFPPRAVVAPEVYECLRKVMLAGAETGVLNLRAVVRAEMGEGMEADGIIADRVGRLFAYLDRHFNEISPEAPELKSTMDSLREVKMLSCGGAYTLASHMVCSRDVGGIDKDELRRAAFAPPSSVLSDGYSDAAIQFFAKVRGQLSAGAEKMAGWARLAAPERLLFVLKYIVDGNLAQALADELGAQWLDNQRETPAFGSLEEEERWELERKFGRGRRIVFPQPIVESQVVGTPVRQVMEAHDAFRRVSQWWAREQHHWCALYERRTYPPGFPGHLAWPGVEGGNRPGDPPSRSQWLMLFIQAALVSLGFNRIGRDLGFSSFLATSRWLDALGAASSNPSELISALDDYLETSQETIPWHFPMRQFIAFYAVGRNLDALLYSLRAADLADTPDAFSMVFSPNANPQLAGTGIAGPPVGGMLGMGSCQLLRELYRLGRLVSPHGHPFAFTPIRKVRNLCAQLFGTSNPGEGALASRSLMSRITELSSSENGDPTFLRCFDLPFQFLAEDPELRQRVLSNSFAVIPEEGSDFDGSPVQGAPLP